MYLIVYIDNSGTAIKHFIFYNDTKFLSNPLIILVKEV